jgi:hypothetical protein
MHRGRLQWIVATVLAVIGTAPALGLRHPGAPAPAAPARAARPAATFTFAPGVSALNRQAFLTAATRVRPAAAALFARVTGLVTVEDGPAPAGALAVTIPSSDGRYVIRFPFGPVYAQLGERGFDRVVDHELGHVVDFVLVPPALDRRLDAGIPPGEPCTTGTPTGSCAPIRERFAETFAKWATGDLGIALYAGYAVPPPADLDAWGRPLAALAR